MKYHQFIIAVLVCSTLSACGFFKKNSEDDRILVANVGESQLYEDEFADIFAGSKSVEDSLKLRDNFIQSWIKQELIFNTALENLSDSVKNKDRELKQYYRSLIRYEYENALINQKLDTSIKHSDILAYYDNYKESFELRSAAARLIFIKLSSSVSKLEKVKDWINDLSVENYDSLHKFCILYADKYVIDDTKWLYYNDVMHEMNAPKSFIVDIINAPTILNYSDSVNTFIVKVFEFKKIGERTPLPLISSKIRSLIKNKKKVDFLREMEKSIVDEATKQNKYQIHVK